MRLLIQNLLFTFDLHLSLTFIITTDLAMEILMDVSATLLVAYETSFKGRPILSQCLVSHVCSMCSVQKSWTQFKLEQDFAAFGKYRQEKCVHCWSGWEEVQEIAILRCMRNAYVPESRNPRLQSAYSAILLSLRTLL